MPDTDQDSVNGLIGCRNFIESLVVRNRIAGLLQIEDPPCENDERRGAYANSQHLSHRDLKSLIALNIQLEPPRYTAVNHLNSQADNDCTEYQPKNLHVCNNKKTRSHKRTGEDSQHYWHRHAWEDISPA